MGLADDVTVGIDAVLAPKWVGRDGTRRPRDSPHRADKRCSPPRRDVPLRGHGGFDRPRSGYPDWASAKTIRCYLNAATRIIREQGRRLAASTRPRHGQVRGQHGTVIFGSQRTRGIRHSHPANCGGVARHEGAVCTSRSGPSLSAIAAGGDVDAGK